MPSADFVPLLERFHKTEREDRFYWHIRVAKEKERFVLRVKRGTESVILNKYLLK
jgi:hypothetical protein